VGSDLAHEIFFILRMALAHYIARIVESGIDLPLISTSCIAYHMIPSHHPAAFTSPVCSQMQTVTVCVGSFDMDVTPPDSICLDI